MMRSVHYGIRTALLLGIVAPMLALPSIPADATFAGDNGLIAFVSPGGGGRIGTISPDGTGRTWLTPRAGIADKPAWSPDGSTIAFQRYKAGRWQIWTMTASGAAAVNISNSRTSDTEPAFGPDSRIAFVRRGDIWIMNADGSAKVALTSSAKTDTSPSWSPNGRWIALQRCCFTGALGQPADQIFRVRVDGSGGRNLSGNGGATADFDPDWSPAGDRIVFSRYDGTSSDQLWMMAADGGAQTKVDPDLNPGEPMFAPDGAHLVAWIGGSDWGIKTMTTSGDEVTYVVDGYSPAWQPLPSSP